MKQDSTASKISNLVNSTTFNPVEVGVELNTEHRYLQEQIFRMSLHFIGQMALNYEKGLFDARNENACKMAHEIIEGLKEKDLYNQKYWSNEYGKIQTS